MEQAIKTARANIQPNEQTQTLSQNPKNSTSLSQISREEHLALFGIINKTRLLNGWTTRTAEELDATIRTWAEVFAKYNIPLASDVLTRLYLKAFDVRQSALQKGDDPPPCDATLLVSQWTGEYGLAAEIKKERIREKKYLTSNAESVCPRCLGTNLERLFSDEGKMLGVKMGAACDHRELVEGEWLWKQRQENL